MSHLVYCANIIMCNDRTQILQHCNVMIAKIKYGTHTHTLSLSLLYTHTLTPALRAVHAEFHC